jgi:hypothetical protein
LADHERCQVGNGSRQGKWIDAIHTLRAEDLHGIIHHFQPANASADRDPGSLRYRHGFRSASIRYGYLGGSQGYLSASSEAPH